MTTFLALAFLVFLFGAVAADDGGGEYAPSCPRDLYAVCDEGGGSE